jgi:hypothetical protein
MNMRTRSHAFLFVLLAMLVTLLASLACSINLGNDGEADDIGMQQTLVVLQMTQVALENQSQDEPELPPDPVSHDEPEASEDPEPTEETVVYEGISFSYSQFIAGGVFANTIPEQNPGEDAMPGMNFPTHFEFTFSDYVVDEHYSTPRIFVFPVEDYRKVSPYASEIIDTLSQTLASRPVGGPLNSFPYLPMVNAGQFFSAKVSYFDFQNGSGVRYLTMFGQDTYPVDNQSVIYTFQGLTHDGRYYISGSLPVMTVALPFDGASQVDDWAAFYDNWDTYITGIVNLLDEQASDSYTPNLDTLDAIMASIQVTR